MGRWNTLFDWRACGRRTHAIAINILDVMGTGHHAAVIARVAPGKSVAVVGDGAVGLCGVIAAKRLGAEQIIILGRDADPLRSPRILGRQTL